MITFLENFHFLRPWWLLAIIIPIVFYAKYFKGIKNKSSWESIVDKNLLGFLLIHGSSRNRKTLGYIALTAFILTIIAISGPTWSKKEAPNMQPENPVMLVLNLSSDMMETDLKPDRLTRAKYKISDLLSNLRTTQVGMIVYTDEPFLISPITDDIKVIDNLLPAISFDIMPSNGDRLDRAINFASTKLKDAGYQTGNIIIFTSDVGQKFDAAISHARNTNYDISLLGISSTPNDKLPLIVQGGVYKHITADDSDIYALTAQINRSLSAHLKATENMSEVWEEQGYWLSTIILALSLYFFRKGIFVIIFILGLSNPASASFFGNDNQDGHRAFSNNDFSKAAEKFNDPNWLGASYYRLGEYDKAYNEFAKTDSLYNQGNALAKAGKIEEAITKYEEVLEADPNHEDAKFNLEYLKQQQQNQQQQQQNQDSEADDNNEQNQGQGSSSEQEQSSEDSENEQQNNDDHQQEQNNNNSSSEEQQQQKSDQQSKQQNAEQKADEGEEEQLTANANAEQKDEDFDEQAQAREQQYREIPQDPGGLLRALIRKEYTTQRYKAD